VSGATVEEAAARSPSIWLKTYYAAGRPEEVCEQIIELAGAAGSISQRILHFWTSEI